MNHFFLRSMEKDNMAYPYKAVFRCNYACYFDEYMGMNIESYITRRSYVCRWKDGELYRYFCDSEGRVTEETREFWIYPNRFAPETPQGALYREEECKEYERQRIAQDRMGKWKNLRANGVINYIPHFFRSRRIKKWIAKIKQFY